MSHERVEMDTIAILGKAHLDWMPMVLINPALVIRLESHENEVPDQVRLAKFATCRVHALENQLRVVLIARQRNIDNHQFYQSFAERGQVTIQTRDLVFKERKILLHPQRPTFCNRLLLHDAEQRVPIALGQQQLVAPITLFERIEQKVAAYLLA